MTQSVTLVTVLMDREGGYALLSRADGMVAEVPVSTALGDSTALSRLQWFPGVALIGSTSSGEDIVFEMPTFGRFGDAESRVSVYLDQKDWRYLTIALDPDSDVSQDQRKDAEQLKKWVSDRKVLLPISSGHYLETTKWSRQDLRYSLGLTMLQLSRGWQLRDPVQVRRNELFEAMRGRTTVPAAPRLGAVVSLHPNVLQESGAKRVTSAHDFDHETALSFTWLVTSCSMIEVMLDQEQIPPAKHTAWETANQAFSDWLDGTERNSEQKRRSIDVMFLRDFQSEVAEEAYAAGATPAQMIEWLRQHGANEIGAMPATGIYREAFYSRHLSAGYRWRHGDLVDMLYLCCAAGYCDIVVCERSTAAALVNGQKRLGRPRSVFRNLHAAMPAIQEKVAERDTG